jgi:hypothetical protein
VSVVDKSKPLVEYQDGISGKRLKFLLSMHLDLGCKELLPDERRIVAGTEYL